MTKIRHMTIATNHLDETVEFYQKVFAFKSSDPNQVILDVNSPEVGWPGAKGLE